MIGWKRRFPKKEVQAVNLLEEIRAAGVRQSDLATAVGEAKGTVNKRLHGNLPMTGDLRAAALRLVREAKVAKAREGLAAAQELLGHF